MAHHEIVFGIGHSDPHYAYLAIRPPLATDVFQQFESTVTHTSCYPYAGQSAVTIERLGSTEFELKNIVLTFDGERTALIAHNLANLLQKHDHTAEVAEECLRIDSEEDLFALHEQRLATTAATQI